MNADRIIQMIINLVMRKLISRGVDAGINRVSGGGQPRPKLSPEEREQRRLAREGKQAARMARRTGRM